MKKTLKLLLIVIMILLLSMVLQGETLATEEKDIEIICTETTDYIFYFKNLTNEEFKYAISDNKEATESGLNYINSVKDDEGNNVAIITNEKYEQIKNANQYIFIKTQNEGTETVVIKGEQIDFANAFNKETMKKVETTTKRIATKELTDIIEQDETTNGMRITVKVGGIEITQGNDATFYSSVTKLPATQYTELMELANRINTEYENMNMFDRIQLAKKFNTLYTELEAKQNWTEVKDMRIMQPNNAQQGEQYVVYIKMVDKDGNETIDAKFMTSQREEREEAIPSSEEIAVQETTRLPITGDTIILFVLLATIIIVATIVFVRMKKLQNQKVEK